MDNQISDQLIPAGYSAHLLTFQINLQPSRRDWSYNALVNITLIPAPFVSAVVASRKTHPYDDGQAPVIIKPLIITDALETSSTARSIEEIRQAVAQFSGTAGRSGLLGLIGGGHEAQQDSAGFSNNSLVTAGVLDDATLHVRLGPERDGNDNLVLTPRTYNISVMVLTRAGDPNTGAGGVLQLEAITHTYFVPTEQLLRNSARAPAALPSARRTSDLARKVKRLIVSYGYPPLDHDCGIGASAEGDSEASTGSSDVSDNVTYLQFLRFLTHGDYQAIEECLHAGTASTLVEQERLYRMLAEISELQDSARYSRMLIPLGNDGTPRLPDPGQYAIVNDAGAVETVTLIGGRNLRAELLRPRVVLSQDTKAWILPTKIAVSTTNPPSVTIAFDAPATLKPADPGGSGVSSSTSGDTNRIARLEILLGRDYGLPCGTPSHGCYMNFLMQGTATGSAASLPADCQSDAAKLLSVSASTLRPARNASGVFEAGVNVLIGDLKKFGSDCVSSFGTNQTTPLFKPPYSLVVANADFEVPQNLGSTDCLTIVDNQLRLKLAGRCISRLPLDDLMDGSSVKLSLVDSTGKALPSSVLELGVARAEYSH